MDNQDAPNATAAGTSPFLVSTAVDVEAALVASTNGASRRAFARAALHATLGTSQQDAVGAMPHLGDLITGQIYSFALNLTTQPIDETVFEISDALTNAQCLFAPDCPGCAALLRERLTSPESPAWYWRPQPEMVWRSGDHEIGLGTGWGRRRYRSRYRLYIHRPELPPDPAPRGTP